MKKKFISVFMIIILILAYIQMPSYANSKYISNANKIAEYIEKNDAIKETISLKGIEYMCMISHPKSNILTFTFNATTEKAAYEMCGVVFDYYLDEQNAKLLKISGNFIKPSNLSFVQSHSTLDTQTFTEDTILKFTHTESDNAPSDINDLYNAILQRGFIMWNSLCKENTGIELKDIGFIAYPDGVVEPTKPLDITGVKFENSTLTYNGEEQSITVTGSLPNGAKVTYNNNKGMDKGTYKATAKVTCDGYNPLTLTATMKIEPAKISIKADNKQMVLNGKVPELTYTVTEGKLFGDDKITGELKTKATGTKIGQFDIEKGTLSVGSNYDLTFEKGILEVVEKTPQNITVSDIEEKTYGDEAFAITVTPDEKSGLNEFTFKSDNTDVAEISEDGTVTIKGAGEANIIVRQEGNGEYAPTENVQKLVVNKKEVTLESVNIDEKTAVLTGVLDSDVSEVSIDFKKSSFEVLEAIDDMSTKVCLKEVVLSGEKAENYTCVSETFETTVSNENIVSVSAVAENGTVAGVGRCIRGSEVTLIAQPDTRYKFSGWYMDGKLVSKEATYTLFSNESVVLEAKFTKKSTGGLGGGSVYVIKFDTDGGSKVSNKSVRKNAIVTEPTIPLRDGYVFKGWFEDKELTKKYDFNTKVTKSITLYASWENIKESQIILTIGDKNAMVFGNKKSNDVAPIIKKDRTMLPARFVAENLGAEVLWNDGIVSISKDDVEITIEIGKAEAIVNGKTVKLDSPAFIENDRTYTPIRFISEALGADVDWNEKTQEVIITKK